MMGLELKNCNIKLTKKQQKYLRCYQIKDEYLTGEEKLPPYQSRILKQAKFTYYTLRKPFEKQIRKNN